MLKLSMTTKFKKDLKLCQKRNYDLNLLNTIINSLRKPEILPIQNKDHDLKGGLKILGNAIFYQIGY